MVWTWHISTLIFFRPFINCVSYLIFLPLHFCRLCLPPTGGDKPWHPGDFALYSLCFRGFHKWTRSPIPRLQTCERLTHLFREILEKHDKSVTRSLCNQHNHPGHKKKISRTATKKRVVFFSFSKQALSELIWTIFLCFKTKQKSSLRGTAESLHAEKEFWRMTDFVKQQAIFHVSKHVLHEVGHFPGVLMEVDFFFHGGNENVCQWFDNPRENTPLCVLQDC